MIKPLPIHPFPARMAPEIALEECIKLPKGSIVLDPMCGSGTTIRAALDHGLTAIGSDLDPMAVLMTKVLTTPIDQKDLIAAGDEVLRRANATDKVTLPWIDNDIETTAFINFWFAEKQRTELRKLAWALSQDDSPIGNALKVAFSRLIITKESGASLARDVSHSRPHKTSISNDFDVFSNFRKSVGIVAKRLPSSQSGSVDVSRRDARDLSHIKSGSVDAVITSPPYLNAIDYMRGHKLTLVWLGHSVSNLRTVRSTSIGAERRADDNTKEALRHMVQYITFFDDLAAKERGMFERYLLDMHALLTEIARSLRVGGKAVFVVGNSCLKGVFIENTQAVKAAASLHGLELVSERERELPANRRYLPPPSAQNASTFEKRMRTEAILVFSKAVI